MQSTVLDFKFILRDIEEEFYLEDYKMKHIMFNYRMCIVSSSEKDFSIVSGIRVNNDSSSEFDSIDEYCGKCKYRYYINGVQWYMSIFMFHDDSSTISAPVEVLIRDSNFDDILIGRMVYYGIFLSNHQRFIIRGEKYKGLISLPSKYTIYDKDSFSFDIAIDRNISESIMDTYIDAYALLNSAVNIGSPGLYYKIIENTKLIPIVLYAEKMDLYGFTADGIFVDIKDEYIDIQGSIVGSNINITLNTVEMWNLSHFVNKYAIISINNNILNLTPLLSGMSKIEVNKRVQ